MGEVILSSIVIILLEVVIALTIGVSLWSVVRSFLNRDRRQGSSNGVPVAVISRCVAIGVLLLLVLTFLLGSSSPITINGEPYDSAVWLRLSDMFVVSVYVMLFLAVAAVVAGRVWSRRLRSNVNKNVNENENVNENRENR